MSDEVPARWLVTSWHHQDLMSTVFSLLAPYVVTCQLLQCLLRARWQWLTGCMWWFFSLFFFSGGRAGAEQEADNHRLPAEEVWAEQETPGDHQQETPGLCPGTALILTHIMVSCRHQWDHRLSILPSNVLFFVLLIVWSRSSERSRGFSWRTDPMSVCARQLFGREDRIPWHLETQNSCVAALLCCYGAGLPPSGSKLKLQHLTKQPDTVGPAK